jgi:glutathione S-transferase
VYSPWKVAVILDELSVPYKHEFQEMSAIKQEPFISVKPNGRVPAIGDPNTGIVLWESGAIIMYLIETYDWTGK